MTGRSVPSRLWRGLVGLVASPLGSSAQRRVLARLGWDLAPGARIGLSWIDAPRVRLGAGATVGHLSVLRRLELVELGERASIGSRNVLSGAPAGGGTVRLALGAAITSGHYVDATGGLSLGQFATLAGRETQVWTHDWQPDGDRRRSRSGPVSLGDRAYVGARSILLPNVVLAERCTVGAGSVVSAKAAARCPSGGTLVGNPANVTNSEASPVD